MKPLYLDGRDVIDIRLDGPALRVRRPGRADGQYPLPRVARIIAVGRVRWQPDALAVCLREHKPVAVLDRIGRFVRVLFRAPAVQFGLARHFGELLSVPRFHERYQRWQCDAERAEMMMALRGLNIHGADLQPSAAWQLVCREQHRRWGVRVGRCYRYLLGLAAAHVSSDLLLAGLRRDSCWSRQEYGLFSDLVLLERWRLVMLVEQLLRRHGARPERWELTEAFERMSDERERRIAGWRQSALIGMRGIDPIEGPRNQCHRPDRHGRSPEVLAAVA